MTISLYIAEFIYKFGGTESYTANLIEALQHIYKDSVITVITELHNKNDALNSYCLQKRIDDAYGTSINADKLAVKYIFCKECKNKIGYFLFQKKLSSITKKFDFFFYCSRGLLTGNAKHNIAVIHFPMQKKNNDKRYKRFSIFKLHAYLQDKKFENNYEYFLPNSQFTGEWLKKYWKTPDSKIKVLYPPVTLIENKTEKDIHTIFICSRIEKSKKIEKLIEAYSKSHFLNENCRLIIAGSIKGESPEYINFIKSMNSTVDFVFEAPRSKIEELFNKSFIFWHAKGYEEENPYQFEHFGITTVEAMSAGCIPVVINKGGQKEIVTQDCGYKWNNLEELVSYTESIYKDLDKAYKMSKASCERSRYFSKENFTLLLKQILDPIKC